MIAIDLEPPLLPPCRHCARPLLIPQEDADRGTFALVRYLCVYCRRTTTVVER